MAEQRVSLFRDGGDQAVRIPRDLELPGTEAIIRSENGKLVIEPVDEDRPEKLEQYVERLRAEGRRPAEEPAGTSGLLALLATLEPLDEDWPEIDDQPPEPVEL